MKVSHCVVVVVVVAALVAGLTIAACVVVIAVVSVIIIVICTRRCVPVLLCNTYVDKYIINATAKNAFVYFTIVYNVYRKLFS